MKQCPTCGSRYMDDSLVYCLQDGATLQAEGDATNPLNLIATLRDDSMEAVEEEKKQSNVSSAPTVKISASALPTAAYEESRATSERDTSGSPAQTETAKPARLVVITVIVTVLLLGLGGIGAWLFFRSQGDGGGRERRTAQANSNAADSPGSSNAQQSANQSRADRPDKGGRWFVILATFSKDDLSRANNRLEVIHRQGFADAHIVSSDDYPNLQDGQWVIVLGPTTRNNAEEMLEKVRPKIKDAYTKSGW